MNEGKRIANDLITIGSILSRPFQHEIEEREQIAFESELSLATGDLSVAWTDEQRTEAIQRIDRLYQKG